MTNFSHIATLNTNGAVRGLTAPCVGKTLRAGLVLALVALGSGCGLKGNLYLPDKSSPVVITPASSSSSSSESSSSSAQATP